MCLCFVVWLSSIPQFSLNVLSVSHFDVLHFNYVCMILSIVYSVWRVWLYFTIYDAFAFIFQVLKWYKSSTGTLFNYYKYKLCEYISYIYIYKRWYIMKCDEMVIKCDMKCVTKCVTHLYFNFVWNFGIQF